MNGYRCGIFLSLLVIASAVSAFGALPKTISYQGYLKDAAGKPVTAATNLIFRLYSSTRADSGAIWTEPKSVTPANGVYSVELGTGTPLDPLPFDRQYFLGVTVESGTELLPRQPLTSSPYAFRSSFAESLPDDTITTGKLADGAVTDAKIIGTISATKLDLSKVVSKSGDTMTGILNLPVDGLVVGTNQLVAAGGRIGIGTATPSPAAALTVNGGILRSGSSMQGTNASTHINLGMNSTTGDSVNNTSFATIGGGSTNIANGSYDTVAGGYNNSATGFYSTVGGGFTNATIGPYSTVSGGYTNAANGGGSAVGGGEYNTGQRQLLHGQRGIRQ